MFQIKKYLHYKNTPDGKPRVLTEGVDYKAKTATELEIWDKYEPIEFISLEDVRPLLTVEIEGEEWTEGDIIKVPIGIHQFEGDWLEKDSFRLLYFKKKRWQATDVSFFCTELVKPRQIDIKYDSEWTIEHTLVHNLSFIGSFFDDPAQYSKLLWNCSEEEGWEKVLKLLNI
jgi:hypothetical protein